MKTIAGSLLLAGSLMLGGRQDMGPSVTVSGLSPSFIQYTYVSDTNGTWSATITSPSISIGPDELIVVYCHSATTDNDTSGLPTVPVTANYNGSSFTVTGVYGTVTYNDGQMNYLYLGSGTPNTTSTFTCTPNSSSGYQGMVVLEFATPGATLNTSSINAATSANSFTTSAFSTTAAPTLNVFCMGGTGENGAFAAGEIAGVPATLVGVDQPYLTSDAMIGCEWNTSSGLISSGTGSMSNGMTTSWVGALASFTY